MVDKVSIIKMNIVGAGIILLFFVGAFALNLFVKMNKDPLESSVDSIVSAIDEYTPAISTPTNTPANDSSYFVSGFMDSTLSSGLVLNLASEDTSDSIVVGLDKKVQAAVYPGADGEYTIYAVEKTQNGNRYTVYESHLDSYVPADIEEAENLLRLSMMGKIDDYSLGDSSRAERILKKDVG